MARENARKVIEQSKNFTKKDFINSRNGSPLQEFAGEKLTVTACAIMEGVDEKQQPIEIGNIVTTEGSFTTISANIIDSIRDIIDMEAEEGAVSYDIKINKRKSKQGRDFLSLIVL